MDTTQTTKKKKSVGAIIVDIVVWIFLIFAIAMTVVAFLSQANDGVPAINGTAFFFVQTPSMEPTIKTGDMIFGKKIETEDARKLEEGTVISFWSDLDGDGKLEINTHRIVGLKGGEWGNAYSFETKGDNNIVADTHAVPVDDVISVWTGTRVPVVGAVFSFVQSQTGFLICIVIPLAAFFIYELVRFIMQLQKYRNKGKKQITQADEELIKQKAIEEYLKQQAAAQAANTSETPAVKVEEAPAETAVEEAPAETVAEDTIDEIHTEENPAVKAEETPVETAPAEAATEEVPVAEAPAEENAPIETAAEETENAPAADAPVAEEAPVETAAEPDVKTDAE